MRYLKSSLDPSKLFNLGALTKQIIVHSLTHYLQNQCNEMSYQTYHIYSQEKINLTHGLQQLQI